MRHLIIGAIFSLLLSYAAPVDACSCGVLPTRIFPVEGQVAPTNTKIFIFDDRGSLKSSSVFQVFDGMKSVDFDAKEFGSLALHGWVITPRSPLRGGRLISVLTNKESFYFYTSQEQDMVAPVLTDYQAESIQSGPPVGDCSSGKKFVKMTLDTPDEVIDRKDPPKSGEWVPSAFSIVKIWISAAGGSVDFTKEPTLYTTTYQSTATFGKGSMCEVEDYDVNSLSGKTINVGISVIDLAGNESKRIEKSVTIKPN